MVGQGPSSGQGAGGVAAARAVAIWRAMACSTFAAGDPALQLLPVSGHHRQPIAAVVDQLAHGLGQGLIGEQDLWGTLVGDRPGQRRPVLVRAAGRAR